MILVGSQRGGAMNLARHLLNQRDNDRAEVIRLKGFLADTLQGAFVEAEAIAKGTRCRQFLFSLSMNPPATAEIGLGAFEDAVVRVEQSLGLHGQPRATIIHEKNGRRHQHVVWSRIGVSSMRAINLPHFKRRLAALSKELYLENGWDLPDGHKTNGWKNPLNFSLAEWQQAKRLDYDPREIKQILRQAWDRTDSLPAFRNALAENGFCLGRGDRRGFVVVQVASLLFAPGEESEVMALPRWLGLKTNVVKAKLGLPDELPHIKEALKDVRSQGRSTLRQALKELRHERDTCTAPLKAELKLLLIKHRLNRIELRKMQEKRWIEETRARAAKFRHGLGGIIEVITGQRARLCQSNQRETDAAYRRDLADIDALYIRQAEERLVIHQAIAEQSQMHRERRSALQSKLAPRQKASQRKNAAAYRPTI